MTRKKSPDAQSKKKFRKICEYAVHYEFCYCYLCGEPILEGQKWNLDHVRPKSKGGPTTPDNLRPVHYDCNQAKADLSLGQYRLIQRVVLGNGQIIKKR